MSKFVFSYKVQALEEFVLFSLELVTKNYEKRSVEWGGARTGWDEPGSLKRIFSVKKGWKRNGSQGIFTCWSLVIDGHLTDWNQTSFLYYIIKSNVLAVRTIKKIMRNVSRLLYWFKTLQAILHDSWAFFTHFLTLRKPFSCIYKLGMAKEAKFSLKRRIMVLNHLHQTFSQ